MIREFHISDVLSVVYDAVLSTRGYDGVCELLDFVKSLYTLQNPQAIREYGPVLVRQHPFLDDPRIHFAIAKLREMLHTTPTINHDALLVGWVSKLTSGEYGIACPEMLPIHSVSCLDIENELHNWRPPVRPQKR